MAIINVSGQSQLLSALKSAHAGDTLSLAGGNYGSVTLARGGLTIQSASDSNQAVFSSLKAQGVSDLTIDNVKFAGSGAGTGLQVSNGSNITVENSDFSDYRLGAFLNKITGLTVSNNTYARMYIDAMNFAGINGGVISKNVYHESGSREGYSHKDFIQFWTNAGNDQQASKNIKITGNSFYSQDGETHGIFINNEWNAQKYQNIYIADNYIKASQTHGISVNNADGVEIRNNTLIKDGSGWPTINVTPDSTHVKIINNTAPSVADLGNSTWILSGNKETASSAYQWTKGLPGTKIPNTGGTAGSTTTDTPTEVELGNGHADEFRFQGAAVTDKVSSVVHADFSEHDTMVFIGYDKGTFQDQGGGNLVWNNDAGNYVKVDSVTDLQELVHYSKAIDANVSGDTLTLTIKQHAGTHTLVLDGLGHEYQSSFDTALF